MTLRRTLTVLFLALTALSSWAIDPMIYTPMFGVIGANNTMSYFGKHLYGIDGKVVGSGSRPQPVAARGTLVAFREPALMPDKMAVAYPIERRQEATRTFRELLAGYQQIEARFGIPRYDMAGALAAFLAGSYMAFRDEDFPDESFLPLVRQMRQVVEVNPEFAKASNDEKQGMYEHLAILGTFMALTHDALKQKPDARISMDMKRAAKGYLEQFLKTDAERVQLTSAGLVLR